MESLDSIQSTETTAPVGPSDPPAPPRRRWRRWVGRSIAGFLLAYLVIAYVVLPAVWQRYARKHPSLDDVPGITHTGSGIPGDPLNVALIGTKAEVLHIMLAAKWYPA